LNIRISVMEYEGYKLLWYKLANRTSISTTYMSYLTNYGQKKVHK
jgi:hypothetical protein